MRLKFVIGFVIVLALYSCQKSDDSYDKPVAAIYDKVLYESDLQNVVYKGISRSDSIIRTKAYIDNWIRQQLVLHQAEANIDESELNFSRQVEDYRNSLIIYKYETQYIEKNLDTVVSDIEIKRYIERNELSAEIDIESVRFIILNLRKKALIEKMNNNLYNNAVRDNVFVIY